MFAEIGNLKLILSFFPKLNFSVTWHSQINDSLVSKYLNN